MQASPDWPVREISLRWRIVCWGGIGKGEALGTESLSYSAMGVFFLINSLRKYESMNKSDWRGNCKTPGFIRKEGRGRENDHFRGYRAGHCIRVVMSMGCYRNQGAGHYGGRCPQCVISVMCSGPLSSLLVPGQHTLIDPEVWLLC